MRPPRNRWNEFQATHKERKEAGLLGKIAMLVVFCAAGGGFGGFIGYLFPIFLVSRYERRQNLYANEEALQEAASTADLRIIIGVIAGIIITATGVLGLWKKMKSD